MAKILCVSGLPQWVSGAHLENLCERYGPVLSARVVRDADGLTMGYGFVEMKTFESMVNAIEALNGSEEFAWRLTVVAVDPLYSLEPAAEVLAALT